MFLEYLKCVFIVLFFKNKLVKKELVGCIVLFKCLKLFYNVLKVVVGV